MDLLADAAWQLAGTGPGSAAAPADLPPELSWSPVGLPNTVAGALRDAGRPVPDTATVDGTDWWLRTTVTGRGPALLEFDGLATVADVWLGEEHVLHAESMFRSFAVEVQLHGATPLTVRCAAPLAWLGRRPRPRWKTALVRDQKWRWLRTTVLGRIPTWLGPVAPAGLWRPARLRTLDTAVVAHRRLAARVDGADGVLDITYDLRGPAREVQMTVGTESTALARGEDGRWRGTVRLRDVALWWPTGYGPQPRHAAFLTVDGVETERAQVAFRTVTADTADGGFAVLVNGARVFLRGAVWQPPDPVSLQATTATTRAALELLRDGGHTVVRVPATSFYETDEFYALCDELGLLVWQDCAFTALDPPDTEEFHAEVRAEIEQLGDRLAGRACVAVVCGGAETLQQPALLGLPPQPVPVLERTVPDALARALPGVPYVVNTPSGGALPVHTDRGIAQYFGVSAYLRPLLDVRAAGVRFAGECLAFSVPPEPTAVLDAFGSPAVAGHAPAWKAAVPRDPSAAWDFEDVRDHYVATLFDVDPAVVRWADSARYLDLGRAAVCTAMAEVFSWWRRPRSGCGGGIVLSGRDFTPGAGWGIVDSGGHPKAPWYALRRALAPTALLVADDGGAGAGITVVHDGPHPLAGTLELTVHGPAGNEVATAAVPVRVGARDALEVSLDEALGAFTDANHYYRFGPRYCDTVRARLLDDGGTVLTSVTALLGHHLRPPGTLDTELRPAEGGWTLHLRAARAVQWLAVEAPGHQVSDSWFHLAAGERATVSLTGPATPPALTVRALNIAERTVAPAPSGTAVAS